MKCYCPPETTDFGIFQARPGTDAVFDSEDADSGLENNNILKLDEKLDQKTGVQNDRPTTARGP